MSSLAIILVSSCVPGCASIPVDAQVYTSIGLNDKVFTENIMFESPAVCVEDCALRCSQRNTCVTITFHQNGCRGYRFLVTSSAAFTAYPGTRSFARKGALPIADWRNSPCASDVECTETLNAECFKGKCLCTPGFFYSIGTRTCAKTCSSLQSTYSLYPGSGIYDNNRNVYRNRSMDDCKAFCSADPKCLNCELRQDNTCNTQFITPIMADKNWNTDSRDWMYFFQRDCS